MEEMERGGGGGYILEACSVELMVQHTVCLLRVALQYNFLS